MNGNDNVETKDQHSVDGLLSPPASTRPSESQDQIPNSGLRTSELGDPLAIEQVADLLGCSPWTVRQRYLRQGLPFLQARPRGKLVFFREQVVAWIEKRQRQLKGGLLR